MCPQMNFGNLGATHDSGTSTSADGHRGRFGGASRSDRGRGSDTVRAGDCVRAGDRLVEGAADIVVTHPDGCAEADGMVTFRQAADVPGVTVSHANKGQAPRSTFNGMRRGRP